MAAFINKFETIKEYYLICGCEVMFVGSKKKCIDYFYSLPKPMDMQLINPSNIMELRRRTK